MRRTGARELVLLAAGVGLVVVGVVSRPRDPTTIGIGTTLLLAPGVAAAAGSSPSDPGQTQEGGQ